MAIRTDRAEVSFVGFFTDGSGAPAIVTVGRMRFALDCLGDIRCNRLDNGSCVGGKLAVSRAKDAYRAALLNHASCTQEWVDANRAMYIA